MEKSRRPVTPSWWTKRTMNLIRTWSPSFNSLSARIETSTDTCYQLWSLKNITNNNILWNLEVYLWCWEQMSDHYFFLLGVLGHVFPIEVDCICCLLVEYSRAANIKDHHIVNIFSIITTKITFHIWITLHCPWVGSFANWYPSWAQKYPSHLPRLWGKMGKKSQNVNVENLTMWM